MTKLKTLLNLLNLQSHLVKADVKTLSMQLTQYKRPSSVYVLKEALPKTTTRKVKRNEVKKLVNA